MNVHHIDFSLGSLARKYIQKEFSSDKWNQFKTWFFDTYSITFTAFQKFVEEDVAAVIINEINNLISRNNYLGLYVKVLGEHISSLDKKLNELIALL
ncbi:hypothetical protein H5410_031381 [Solanum commersonii]|uniref:DUF7588 domain-containing protein n=1 Tax=Solanum commersonii TaxID=4109 RepID=A0A9J5YGZ3_SOLCO|nr:hypothetical protein H5410_031381 [Solanum commersonii]